MTIFGCRRATGRIDVTSSEALPLDDAGEFTISQLNVTEEFGGDLVGIGSVRFIMVEEPGGTKHFTGMDRFLGKIGDRSGSFIFQNWGRLRNSDLRSTWRVIPESGTEELSGLCGEDGCTQDGYWLDHWFE